LEWLKRTLPHEVAQINHVIEATLNTLRPLLQASNTQLDCHIADHTPEVAGQLAALRQALLNLLMAAAHAASGGKVRLSAQPHPPDIHLLVEAIAERTKPAATREVAEKLEMARQFIDLFGGELELLPTTAPGQVFGARLKVPATEQLPVLVIDDNADTLRLIQRYLAGTRYCFLGCPHPDLAFDLVTGTAPRLIVLDVMLPGLDDWEMLGRLREHPQTHGVPVIICTILPQEQLALALGAAAFLRKPVRREQLLAKLDQLADSPAKESV
jgi:CheY-like chemotaxis protein